MAEKKNQYYGMNADGTPKQRKKTAKQKRAKTMAKKALAANVDDIGSELVHGPDAVTENETD